ncbi:MAG: hypothetical protein KKH08_05800 [Candidatus Omnitrophica bacterium]|nr:hypothetical protein [Candidatus Omnitrophota bacterium]
MDKEALYYHFSNLALVLIGLFSIHPILNPFVALILIPGTVAGFLVSWYIKDSRPQHMDTFTGMLSLAVMIIILGRLYDTDITFDNLLKIFSTALAWLTLFQSFGLKSGKSYAVLQFISVCLFVSSLALALAAESFYVILIAVFLFMFIFAMRLNLVCEKKRKGSLIIGDREKIMSLWQQIKVGALMFSFVLIIASIIYPFVPRFENLSLRQIPSTLLGIPEQIPILKLLLHTPKTIKHNEYSEKDQLVDAEIPKRETDPGRKAESLGDGGAEEKEETMERFRAKEFDQDIDIFKIKSLKVTSDKKEIPLDEQCELTAEITMNDGSVLPATRLVDWKTIGTADVAIDNNGKMTPKEEGYVKVSASYTGTFSNDMRIDIKKPLVPIKKKGWGYYGVVTLLWLLVLAAAAFFIRMLMESKRLSELAAKDPREFIKELYAGLCRGFRPYGMSKLDFIAPREFFEEVKTLMPSAPEPMRVMTENVLEARFSAHEISGEHSRKALDLFHDIKAIVLEREEGKHFWRKILFSLLLLDILLLPRQR